MVNCFEEENLVVRLSGDTLVLSPALIASEDEIGRMAEAIHAVLARMPENT
jgi:adenosylmethionine-8-amino-7-oxononanoate aminotransferase